MTSCPTPKCSTSVTHMVKILMTNMGSRLLDCLAIYITMSRNAGTVTMAWTRTYSSGQQASMLHSIPLTMFMPWIIDVDVMINHLGGGGRILTLHQKAR